VDARQIELPLYRTVMEKIGKPVVFNISVLGALLAMQPLVQTDSIMKLLGDRFPSAFIDLNRQALELGYALGEKA
jgi:2-oxoglutarate ferredoxin oxidoreductase subunit gamma